MLDGELMFAVLDVAEEEFPPQGINKVFSDSDKECVWKVDHWKEFCINWLHKLLADPEQNAILLVDLYL